LEKKIIISTIASLNYFKGFSVLRTSSVQETAEVLVHMANKIDRNFMKGILPSYLVPEKIEGGNEMLENKIENTESYSGFVKKVKKDNITPDNIGEILLCQIPGISSLYAKSILTHFSGFSKMLEKIKDSTANFENITYEDSKGKTRKIPKTCGTEIIRFMMNI
jgi:ERCC4-type nuclease